MLFEDAIRGQFINILQAAFMCSDPECTKRFDNLTVFFALLGSAHVKAALKIFAKLTLGASSKGFQSKKLLNKATKQKKSSLFLNLKLSISSDRW